MGLVLGSRLHGFGSSKAIMASPWGFVLARGAAQLLVQAWNTWCRKHCEKVAHLKTRGGLIDYAFGYCLFNNKPPAQFLDTRDANDRDRFILWPPSRINRNDWWDSWYPNMRIDKPIKAISPGAVLFFFAGPAEIRELGELFR